MMRDADRSYGNIEFEVSELAFQLVFKLRSVQVFPYDLGFHNGQVGWLGHASDLVLKFVRQDYHAL